MTRDGTVTETTDPADLPTAIVSTPRDGWICAVRPSGVSRGMRSPN
ncbi:MAG: hypothetical protein ACAF41_03250 [Leptolyngbya sp. BL-A-14]